MLTLSIYYMPSYAKCFVMFCKLFSIPNSFVAIMGNIHLLQQI